MSCLSIKYPLYFEGLPEVLETQDMVDFFEDEEVIPSEVIEMMKQRHPAISSCLEEASTKKEIYFSGSYPLENTTERKLVALTCVFFAYRNTLFRNTLGRLKQCHIEKDNPEYYDFLGRIKGVTIVEKCDPNLDFRLCHTFIFGHHDWYKEIKSKNKTLLSEPQKVLEFLDSKGYKRNTEPDKGQVVVYHTMTSTNHFAKIVEIESREKEKAIIVVSKFGSSHIYRHPISLTLFHYGNSVTFLSPPKENNARHMDDMDLVDEVDDMDKKK